MDTSTAIAVVWLVCAVTTALIGRLGGRSGDAMTLGVFLGPIGLALAMGLAVRHRRQAMADEPVILKISDAQRARASVSVGDVRRSA